MHPAPQLLESSRLPAPRRCFWVAGIQISQLSGPREAAEHPDILEHFVPPRAGPPFYHELEAAPRIGSLSFEQVFEISSQHGISILSSRLGCQTGGVPCPPADVKCEKQI